MTPADMTLAEDLVLLLLDPGSGRAVVDSTSLDRAIGGALLLDLAARERITADGDGARARLSVAGAAPTGDPLLDGALARLDRPLRAQKAVERLARGSSASSRSRPGRRGTRRSSCGTGWRPCCATAPSPISTRPC